MKIAVCLSGHLRTFEHCYQSLFDLLPCRPDVFAVIWNTEVTPEKEARFREIYQPVRADIRHPVKQKERGGIRAGTLAMWCGIKLANDLRRDHEEATGQPYDLVIRTRPDTVFKDSLTIRQCKDLRGTISIPDHSNHAGIQDQFCIADGRLFDVYAGMYDHLLNREPPVDGTPEFFLKDYLGDHPALRRIDLWHRIRRPWQDGTPVEDIPIKDMRYPKRSMKMYH